MPVRTSIFASSAFNKDFTKIAIAVGDYGKSAIYVGAPTARTCRTVSNTDLATHPAWSPSGKARLGRRQRETTARSVSDVDGKPASPQASPRARRPSCDTEDGIRLVYSVSRKRPAGSHHVEQKPVGVSRLTQGQAATRTPRAARTDACCVLPRRATSRPASTRCRSNASPRSR